MICIQGGRVYDPANGENGALRDVWLDDDARVIAPVNAPHETFDASGCAVMAGAIDVHSHIAGEPLNLLRDAGNPLVPDAFTLSAQYARMGYVLAANAAMPALAARRTVLEERAMPGLDTLNLVWVGENPALSALAASGSDEALDEYLSWLLSVSGGFGLKLINPCNGAEDGALPYQKLIGRLIDANERLALPHPLHLHHPFLARPGAFAEVNATIERAEGRRLHLAHVQFYGYQNDEKGHVRSAAEPLACAVNAHQNITVDVGAAVFGPAAAVTADTEFAKKLGGGKKGFRSELWERDGGFGVLPLSYAASSVMGATQFITGLELMLLIDDPARVFLTTDHPNGGPFTAYPLLLSLLMSRARREEALAGVHPKALNRNGILDLEREYSLYDVACMTRSGPAKRLGLKNFGHLAPGAAGGAVVYRPGDDLEAMFASPAAVFRGPAAVHAAAKRPFDAARVRAAIAPYCSVDLAAMGTDDAFFDQNGVIREVR